MSSALATELNEAIRRDNPGVYGMLSELGRELYFPKGILTQTAEAKQKAHRYNATIGIAREKGTAMHLEAVTKYIPALDPDELLPYAPSTGRPDLRAKWKDLLVQKNPTLNGKAFSLPIVTSGITHGLSIVADMFVEGGDLVLLPEKLRGNYNMIFGVRRGASIARYPFFTDAGQFDVDGLHRCLLEHASQRKILVVLNFPNNPTGYTVTEREAMAVCRSIEAIAERNCSLIAVCDDAYFGLFYGPETTRESLFARLADIHENVLAVKLDGATKEDYVWGFRVGFITLGTKNASAATYDALEKKIGGSIRGTISNCAHHSQSILMKAMMDNRYAAQRDEKFEVLRRRAARVKEVLSDERFSVAWTPYPFNSGYFMCLKLKHLNAELFRVRLLERYGIGIIATAATDVRVAFSCVEEEDIADLFRQMLLCAEEMVAQAGCANQSVPTGVFEE
jgi:aspartate/methionine/tyrosine aminotransferase